TSPASRGKSLGREKGFEYAGKIFGWNATTEILDGEAHITLAAGSGAVGGNIRWLGCKRHGMRQFAGDSRGDDNFFTIDHRFGGVEDQIEENLLDKFPGNNGLRQAGVTLQL